MKIIDSLFAFVATKISELQGKTNYRVVRVNNSSATTIAADGTAWVTVPAPTGCTPLAVVGYYMNGSSRCFVYQLSINENDGSASFAIRNGSTSTSQTFTMRADFLVVDE